MKALMTVENVQLYFFVCMMFAVKPMLRVRWFHATVPACVINSSKI